MLQRALPSHALCIRIIFYFKRREYLTSQTQRIIGGGLKGELGALSTPTCKSADTRCRSPGQPRTHTCTRAKQQQLLQQQHACRFMHASSCIPVHPRIHACTQQQHACMHAGSYNIHAGSCMPVQACQLLPMRACARRAHCKKCRVDLGSKRSGW
jgi:hypothetical protein